MVLTKPIVLPRPGALPGIQTRLGAWLKMANDARDALTEADALRGYYLILEDIAGSSKSGQLAISPGVEVKLMRDFVSHGKLKNNGVLQLVASELGYRTQSYDPHQNDQRQMVAKYRDIARGLVYTALQQYT